MSSPPPFGQADLSNCDRELIHLAGSIQPHGMLWVLSEPDLRIVQASRPAAGSPEQGMRRLLAASLRELGGDIEQRVRELLATSDLHEGAALRCRIGSAGRKCEFEGLLHRGSDGLLIAELEPVPGTGQPAGGPPSAVETVHLAGPDLLERLSAAVQRLSEATSIDALADAVVGSLRDLVGYDRVMVYRFDPEGHGKIIGEARDARLAPLLGHHYPASDIPQRARELYLRNRVRVLVDVAAEPAPLEPRLYPGSGSDLDMSMCYLRAMSPLHLRYLRNMGVTATLVVSLVREGRLWGLIACHHYRPRNLRLALRTAADLLGEVASTRIAAIENHTRAQVATQVQQLGQRLLEATAAEGDWRLALFRSPAMLLQPLEASGAVLQHEGQFLSCGEVPATPDLRRLLEWVQVQPFDQGTWACGSVVRANPRLASLTPLASGVLAVQLSAAPGDCLLWFRKEQLLSVTWAGDPAKPMVGNDPLELSPRRSFDAWSQLVRDTSQPWTDADLALARAYGRTLVDIIVQVGAVRLLIAEHQLAQVRASVAGAKEPLVVADPARRVFYANDAFLELARCTPGQCADIDALVGRFARPLLVRQVIGQVQAERRPWRGELELVIGAGTLAATTLPVTVRAEPVPARDGSLLGLVCIFEDLTESRRADAARDHLQASLSHAGRGLLPRTEGAGGGADLVAAILANASLAAMDIADGGAVPAVAPLLQELEISTQRATSLYGRIRSFSAGE